MRMMIILLWLTVMVCLVHINNLQEQVKRNEAEISNLMNYAD